MQIIRTEVTQASAPTGQPILRVIFCGEGGDCVTVDMARVKVETMRPLSIERRQSWSRPRPSTWRRMTTMPEATAILTKSPSLRPTTRTAGCTSSNIAMAKRAIRFLRPGCRAWKLRGRKQFDAPSIFWSTFSPARTIFQVGSCACETRTAKCSAPSTCGKRKRPARQDSEPAAARGGLPQPRGYGGTS